MALPRFFCTHPRIVEVALPTPHRNFWGFCGFLGIRPGGHDLLPVSDCFIQEEDSVIAFQKFPREVLNNFEAPTPEAREKPPGRNPDASHRIAPIPRETPGIGRNPFGVRGAEEEGTLARQSTLRPGWRAGHPAYLS